jgi:hypothetical protein
MVKRTLISDLDQEAITYLRRVLGTPIPERDDLPRRTGPKGPRLAPHQEQAVHLISRWALAGCRDVEAADRGAITRASHAAALRQTAEACGFSLSTVRRIIARWQRHKLP